MKVSDFPAGSITHSLKLSLLIVLTLLIGLTGCGKESLSDIEYVERAKNHLEQVSVKAAIIELKNALQQNPNNLEARWLLGRTYVDAGNGEAAEKELRRAMDLGLGWQEWLVPLTKAYLLQGNNDRVLKEISVNPDDPANLQSAVLVVQGLAHLAKGQTEEAEAKFTQALELDADNVDALLGQSQLALASEDYAKAEALVEKALANDPSEVRAWLKKGELAFRQERYAEGLDAYQQALELQPNNASARIGRAEILIRQNELEKALAETEALRKSQPNLPQANYLHGRILFQLNRFDPAREALQQVLRVVPNHLPSQLLLGAIDYANNNLEQAQVYLNRFVAAFLHPGGTHTRVAPTDGGPQVPLGRGAC